MAFSRFLKKGVRFARKSFNAVVGAAVSTVTAGVVTAVSALIFPFVLLGGSIYAGFWSAEKVLRRGQSSAIGIVTGVVAGIFASIPITLAAGLLAVGGNLASPFLGVARGFMNGLVAALIPSILYYSVYDRHRERNRQEYERRLAEVQQRHADRRPPGIALDPAAEPGLADARQAASPRQRARQALARYLHEPQVANDELVEKISELKPLPGAHFELLGPEELKQLEEEKEGPVAALLSEYKTKLASVNATHNGCSISLASLDEMKPCLTVEYKMGDVWHHLNYDADSFLLHIRSGQRNQLANLPENRLPIDGHALELGAGNASLQQAEHFKIYKGFHADVLASFNAEVKPARDQLRDFLRQKQARSGQGAASPRGFWQEGRAGQAAAVARRGLPEGDKQDRAALRCV